MCTVACVLRSGGEYDVEWVRALKWGVDHYLLPRHRFVCLTDMDVDEPGVEVVPLAHRWPGWWSKIEALDPVRLGGRVILMDLDTLPVGNLYQLYCYNGEWAMLRALNARRRAEGKMVSGVMAYRGGLGTEAARLYEMFAEDPEKWMTEWRGDGEFLEAHSRPDGLQDYVPGIVSFKWDTPDERPKNACLVLGHGQPRFNNPAAGWAHDEWMRRAA